MQWRFATTSWTQVLAARASPSSESRAALESLCKIYWYPLYAFVRRQGFGPEESRDLTQSYFSELLEKGYLEDFNPSRGRFRVFLKASLQHFLSKERDRSRTLKRGGRVGILSLDDRDPEGRYRHEPVDRLTPEEIFERRWALVILERALGRLRSEFSERGRGEEFEILKGYLTGEAPKVPYRQAAATLQTTEEAVKTSVHRLRQKFGKLLREEIAETVSTPEEIDDEVRHLLKTIAR
jgi:RNA polymerase sigma-70 factor (ECF subfamily)